MDNDPVIEQAITAAKGPRPKKKTKVHKGPIHSSVAGRTDHLPMHVASGSYVIPADIISAMGEGNSMAGFKVAKSIFSISGPYDQPTGAMPYGGGEMPYGQPAPRKRAYGGSALEGQITGAMDINNVNPYMARAPLATGGAPDEAHDAVPIVAAGGEYVISPEEVTHIGGGSMEDGHKILDAFVKKMRKKTIRTLQSLPGPKKD